MKILLLFSAILFFTSPKIYGQEIELKSNADVKFHLMNEKAQQGTSVQHTVKEASINTDDILTVQVYKNPNSPYPDDSFGLLFRLKQSGTNKLDSLASKNPGQYLTLRSHGHTFNSKRLGSEFSGEWLLWNASLTEIMAKKWLNHITGEELLPDPFREK